MKDSAFTLDPKLDDDLSSVADQLGISQEEAVRRALELFKHAASAHAVELVTEDGQRQLVKVK
jgi:hypothetical protein